MIIFFRTNSGNIFDLSDASGIQISLNQIVSDSYVLLLIASKVPRYIITLHELLAHTPHNHVERKSLENARMKLEELSRV